MSMKRFSSIVGRVKKGSKPPPHVDSRGASENLEKRENSRGDVTNNSLGTIASIFQPLDLAGKEIRLVTILPGTGQLTCELKAVSLKTYPIYEALSWAWGDALKREEITVNGLTWWAPVNLIIALKFLRRRDRSRVIWVDALSINQSTAAPALTERAHQVQLMKYIYSAASHVIVWMGQPSDELAAFLERCFMGNESMESLFARSPSNTIQKVIEWLESGWWRRLWVVQEVFLPGKVSYCFGRHSIPFLHVLSETAAFWYLLGPLPEDIELYSEYIRVTFVLNDTVGTFLGIRDRYEQQASLQASLNRQNLAERSRKSVAEAYMRSNKDFARFVEKLISCRYLLTSDPRDKIYGVLGLGDDQVSELLQPRYDTTVEQVYITSTANLIRKSQSLYLLSQARGVRRSALQLPSWVPDWTIESEAHDRWLWNSGVSRDDREYIFQTYGMEKWYPPVDCILPKGRLKLEGMMVGRISTYTELLVLGASHWWSGAQQWRQFARYRELASDSTLDQEGGKALEDNRAFWRTILYATLPRDFVYPVTFPLPLEEAYIVNGEEIKHRPGQALYGQVVRCDLGFQERCIRYPKEKLHRKSAQGVIRSEEDLFRHVTRVTANKKLFRTGDDFLGLGPAEIEEGDQVWILKGGTHPFILRPKRKGRKTEFQLVGEAYVDRIMWSTNASYSELEQLGVNKFSSEWDKTGLKLVEPEWESVVLG